MATAKIHHWHELTEQEKVPIKETSDTPNLDYPIISVIDGLSRDEQKRIYDCLAADPLRCKDYNALQKRWLRKEKEYLALRRNQHPDQIPDSELVNDMEEMRTCYRYKLYYLGRKIAEDKLTLVMTRFTKDSLDTLRLITEFIDDIISVTSEPGVAHLDGAYECHSENRYMTSPNLERVYPAVCPLLKRTAA